jgi:NTE family protein
MWWPSSRQFLEDVLPAVHERLTTADLFSLKAIGWRGLGEFNTDLVRSRATVLAKLLERNWRITGRLAGLPDTPNW